MKEKDRTNNPEWWINRKDIIKSSMLIANLSASEDKRDKTWWGHDTDLGKDLPKDIENELIKSQKRTIKAILIKLIKDIEILKECDCGCNLKNDVCVDCMKKERCYNLVLDKIKELKEVM